jgi:hypothetical protein
MRLRRSTEHRSIHLLAHHQLAIRALQSIAVRLAEGERQGQRRLQKLLAGITPEKLPDVSFDDRPVGEEAL